MKDLLKVLAFIPLGIELLLIVIFQSKIFDVFFAIHFSFAIVLVFLGICILSKKKIIQVLWSVVLASLTIFLCIRGYYDYFQWFSSIVGIILFIYFTLLKIAMKKLKVE